MGSSPFRMQKNFIEERLYILHSQILIFWHTVRAKQTQMDEQTDGQMDGRMDDGWMGGWTGGWVDG